MPDERYKPATYSPEGRIVTALDKLGCTEASFARLVSNIVGRNRLNQALNDSRKSLDNITAGKLLERISWMESLQNDVNAATKTKDHVLFVNWEKTEIVQNALVCRLVHQIEHEFGNNEFQAVNDRATKAVANVGAD
jgi:hypothetical protein